MRTLTLALSLLVQGISTSASAAIPSVFRAIPAASEECEYRCQPWEYDDPCCIAP